MTVTSTVDVFRTMALGLLDRLQLTIFPVIAGKTGAHPLFEGSAGFDLDLLERPDLRRRDPEARLPTHSAWLSLSRPRAPAECVGRTQHAPAIAARH